MAAIVCAGRPDTPEAAGLEVVVTPGSPSGTVRVRVSGEIDFDDAALLREALQTALVSHRGTLLLDLSRVTFCDCAGLNVLLAASAAALSAGRRMRITRAGRAVERLLDLTATRPFLT
ncbi:STAS domain-containing protein [Streptomyces sp. NPDC059989]|uniref:STAS domain-containing protein n=1 Tax=Streptomyces sp. NPDC059989 TaxID=3347026 RepID=UPI00367AB4E8